MSEAEYEFDDTPTGMQPRCYAGYLVYNEAHPHIDEYNQPVEHGENKPDKTEVGAQEFKSWQDKRARINHDTGSPLPPGGATP